MTNTEFFVNIPPECADIDLLVEGEIVMLSIFLFNNLIADDVDHIALEDAQMVIDLMPGESTYVGIVEVKRIS